ncbi:hypothetical protein EV368DRAFT_67511 [Lentinula lateritia]|nr:hypothetical protein EV368DRAFT_67511 [Lentinula lateritia]
MSLPGTNYSYIQATCIYDRKLWSKRRLKWQYRYIPQSGRNKHSVRLEGDGSRLCKGILREVSAATNFERDILAQVRLNGPGGMGKGRFEAFFLLGMGRPAFIVPLNVWNTHVLFCKTHLASGPSNWLSLLPQSRIILSAYYPVSDPMLKCPTRKLCALYEFRKACPKSAADGPGVLYVFVEQQGMLWKVSHTNNYHRRQAEWDRQCLCPDCLWLPPVLVPQSVGIDYSS